MTLRERLGLPTPANAERPSLLARVSEPEPPKDERPFWVQERERRLRENGRVAERDLTRA